MSCFICIDKIQLLHHLDVHIFRFRCSQCAHTIFLLLKSNIELKWLNIVTNLLLIAVLVLERLCKYQCLLSPAELYLGYFFKSSSSAAWRCTPVINHSVWRNKVRAFNLSYCFCFSPVEMCVGESRKLSLRRLVWTQLWCTSPSPPSSPGSTARQPRPNTTSTGTRTLIR